MFPLRGMVDQHVVEEVDGGLDLMIVEVFADALGEESEGHVALGLEGKIVVGTTLLRRLGPLMFCCWKKPLDLTSRHSLDVGRPF